MSQNMYSIMQASHCSEVDRRWTYEYEVSHDLWEVSLVAKDFEVAADAGETQPM